MAGERDKWRDHLTEGERVHLAFIENERAEIRQRKRELRIEHNKLLWAGRDRARAAMKDPSHG